MAIAAVTEGLPDDTTAQTIECPAPASIVDGNMLRIIASAGNDVNITIGSAGWTQVAHVKMIAGIDGACAVFYKIADGETGTYTVNVDGGVGILITAQCSQFSGVDASPIDATATTITDQSVTNFDPPAITTQTANAFVETVVWARLAAISLPAVPSGYTEFGERKTTNNYFGSGYIDAGAADAEDPGTWGTFGGTADCCGITWAFRETQPSGLEILVPTGPIR